MKVNILGTEYEIIMNAEEKDYPKLKDAWGYTDFTIRKIVISKFIKTSDTLENEEIFIKKVLRHEIIHAFLIESGLNENSNWARNEELVDWIALQFEKMLNVFLETKAINSIGVDINVYDRTSEDPVNDPINHPKVKEAKAYIKIPEIKIPEIKPLTNKEMVDRIGEAIKGSLQC